MVIDRYIARTVLSGVLLATLILLGVFAFVDLVAQLKHVGTADYGSLQAVMYVLLILPQRLYELSPSILLLGSIMSLGTMAANSELIVMRASGVSIMRITRSVLQVGLLIAIFVVVIGEWMVPKTTSMAKTLRAESLEKKIIVGGYNDIWARDGNRYVNVKKVMPDHQLRNIRVYELSSDRQLQSMIFAERAHYVNGKWQVFGVQKTTIFPQQEDSLPHTEVAHYKLLQMDRLILLELFSVLELEAQDMSSAELYTYSNYLESNNLEAGEYKLAFWIKMFMPLTCLAMLLIAMPLVFSTTPRSGGAGQRIVMAVIIGVVFFVFSRAMNFLGLAMGMEPVISAALPLVLVISLSLLMLKRLV